MDIAVRVFVGVCIVLLSACQGGDSGSLLAGDFLGNALSLKISESKLSADEGDVLKIILLLEKEAPIDLKIKWELLEGATDFEHSTGEFTIKAGQSAGQLGLKALADLDVEGDETFKMKVWSEQLANSLEVELIIHDKTDPGPVVLIGPPSLESVNSTGLVSFPVTVTGALTVDIKDSDVILSGDISGCSSSVANSTTNNPVIEIRGCDSPGGSIKVALASGVATDSKGNSNRMVPAMDSIEVDNVAPATLGSWALSSPVNGSNSNDAMPEISASGLADATQGEVAIYNESSCSNLIGSARIDSGGEVVVNAALKSDGSNDGLQRMFAKIYDKAGNSFSAGCLDLSLSYTLDTQSPDLTISSPSPTSISSGDTATFQLTYAGATSLSLTNSDISLLGDTSGCSKALVAQSANTYDVRISGCDSVYGTVSILIADHTASDAAGNLSLGANSSSLMVDNSIGVTLSPLDFNDVTNATLETNYVESFTLSGFTGAIQVVPTGQLSLSKDGASYDNAALTLQAGDSFYARMQSGSANGVTTSGSFSLNHTGGSFRTVNWTIATPSACAGKMIAGYCWLRTASSEQSCTSRCSSYGGVHPATRYYAGNYGSVSQCKSILTAFGAKISSSFTSFDFSQSAGCYHGNTDWGNLGGAFTHFDQGANSGSGSRRYCACNSGSNPPPALADPLNLQVAGVNSTSAALKWTHPAGSGNARYKIAYQAGATAPANCNSAQVDGSKSLGSSSTEILNLVEGLTPTTTYSFRVCASDDLSPASYSSGETITLTTKASQSTSIALASVVGFSPADGQTVITENIKVSGTSPYLLINTAERGSSANDIISIEFNGLPLTKISSLKGSWVTQDLWYLADPPKVTANLVITKSTSSSFFDFTAAVYENVHPTNPHTVLDSKSFDETQYQAMLGSYASSPGSLVVAAFSYYDYYGIDVRGPLSLDSAFKGYVFHNLRLYSTPGDSSLFLAGGFTPYGGFVALSLKPAP